ncbi:MAG: peptidylprolyl isomerase [Ignavibacteriales bacterium]|nr:peptidylprolyl isomerase [Ignavibacteriales bacterium]
MPIYVNDEKISAADVRDEVERLRPQFEAQFQTLEPGERNKQLTEWAQENLIERVLIVQAAKKREDLRLGAEELERAWTELREKRQIPDNPEFKEQFELGVRVEKMLAEIAAHCELPDNDESKEFFSAHPQHFVVPEQVRASHLLKEVRSASDDRSAFDAIKEIERDVRAGKSFEQAIAEHSDDSANGGDLGYFVRGQASKEFEDAVFAAAVGDVTPIVRTEFGYHLAKVHDRRPPTPVSFEEANDQIKQHLLEGRKETAIADFIEDLRKQAHIVEHASLEI